MHDDLGRIRLKTALLVRRNPVIARKLARQTKYVPNTSVGGYNFASGAATQ